MTDARTGRRARAGALIAMTLAAAVGGCDIWPHEPRDPLLMDVLLATPHASDQAALIAFHGPAGSFTPAPGFVSFRDPAAGPALRMVVVASTPLNAGERRIGTLEVGPAGAGAAAEAVTAEVIEVARSDHALREGLEGYAVRLVPRAGAPTP